MLLTIANFVTNSLPTQITLISMVLEIILRLFPTQQPLSLLKAFAAITHQLALIFTGIDNFMNKIVPQNLK